MHGLRARFGGRDRLAAHGHFCHLPSSQIARNAFSIRRHVSACKMHPELIWGVFGVQLSRGHAQMSPMKGYIPCQSMADRELNFRSQNHTPWVPNILAQRTSLSPRKRWLQRPLQGRRLTTADSIAACQSYPIGVFGGLLVTKHEFELAQACVFSHCEGSRSRMGADRRSY